MNEEKTKESNCHEGNTSNIKGLKTVVLVGNPNVGKSLIFSKLSGAYAIVSNYPGTSVTLDISKAKINGETFGVIDTPGMYSLSPITEEERVARDVLIEKKPKVVVNVVDAKNLDRMLHLTLELIDAKLPVVLVINMMDEARKLGIDIDIKNLSRSLGIPVVQTVSTTGEGIPQLKKLISGTAHKNTRPTVSDDDSALSANVKLISKELKINYGVSKKTISLLLLQNDSHIKKLVKKKEKGFKVINKITKKARKSYHQPIKYLLAMERQRKIADMVKKNVVQKKQGQINFKERLSRLMMNPITGIIFFFLVMYLALYKFVGGFGAGTMVDFLEANIFETYVNPFVNQLLTTYIPWEWLRNLIGFDYGIITLGVRYSFAIILPVVATFFIVFSIIEDSGYLPRLAMLIDRVFKRIGLNGRAVIPMVLGFGCDTMATVVTRTQETKRERIITTLLLALAIPCSAQLGVIFGLLSVDPLALWIWVGVITLVFLLVGYLASKIVPGEEPFFYMEIPPLRMPRLANVFTKTYTRMVWYFKEILPVFIIASVLIWFGKLTGLFDLIINALIPVVGMLDLPPKTAETFLFGFFRRDYGAAGLFDMQNMLSARQLLVAATTLTLFVPCVAQFAVMLKERGWKVTLAIVTFIIPFAFFVGYILNLVLRTFGVL